MHLRFFDHTASRAGGPPFRAKLGPTCVMRDICRELDQELSDLGQASTHSGPGQSSASDRQISARPVHTAGSLRLRPGQYCSGPSTPAFHNHTNVPIDNREAIHLDGRARYVAGSHTAYEVFAGWAVRPWKEVMKKSYP